MSAYWWIDPPLFFGGPFDQELEDAWKIIEADGLAPPGTILPNLSRHVLNDWCDVIGFLEPPPATEVEQYRNSERSVWEADLTFRNVDGAFWLMHSRDEQLYAAVEGYLHKIPDAKCFYEDLDADG
ncbi:hypothetical protein [Lacipirellula limnantheis]|uniref:hypothetical protein n=1 Tax=Lacipirellula limnantheis TaxID=2528024 RepID=UPI0011A36102|nr:hypothetical protein [Lacipirellula limnantheis]